MRASQVLYVSGTAELHSSDLLPGRRYCFHAVTALNMSALILAYGNFFHSPGYLPVRCLLVVRPVPRIATDWAPGIQVALCFFVYH